MPAQSATGGERGGGGGEGSSLSSLPEMAQSLFVFKTKLNPFQKIVKNSNAISADFVLLRF